MARKRTNPGNVIPALAEVFREHGYEGASLSLIASATGLGKGSLYNFFPGGKEEMMACVLADIDGWFETAIFSRLEQVADPATAIAAMFRDVVHYFRSGEKVCLVGALGLGSSRDPFARQVSAYFTRWIGALSACLERTGVPESRAKHLAEGAVAGIQGAIVLSRALDDTAAFLRIVGHHEACLTEAVTSLKSPE